MTFEMTALLLSWVAILLLSLVVAGLVRQVHALTRGPRSPAFGLPAGSPAPGLDWLAPVPAGPTLLLFLSKDCGACPEVLQEAVALSGDARVPAVQALFAGAAADADPAGRVLVHPDQATLFEAYRVLATPFAVLVDEDGRVRLSQPVGSPRALRELVAPDHSHPASDPHTDTDDFRSMDKDLNAADLS